MAKPLRFPSVMLCTQQHPTGFTVLHEVMRNGGIYHIPVHRLHAPVNHWAMQCVRFAAKNFTDFTSIDFGTAKLSRRCTARYRKAPLCTLLYACFAYQPSVQRQILHLTVKCFTVRTSKNGF